MRTAYHDQLSTLRTQLSTMCGETADAMHAATESLLAADLDRAERVIRDRSRIAALSGQAWQEAFDLLALQQPVAADLRAVVSAIHIAADVDRMTTLAVHIAQIARRRHPNCAVPEEVKDCFADMGGVAVQMAKTARDVVASYDPVTAARLSEDDDAMDDLHRLLLSALFDPNWPHGVIAAVDVALGRWSSVRPQTILRALRRPRRRDRQTGRVRRHRCDARRAKGLDLLTERNALGRPRTGINRVGRFRLGAGTRCGRRSTQIHIRSMADRPADRLLAMSSNGFDRFTG